MKRFAAILIAAALLPGVSHANGPSDSEASAYGTISVLGVSIGVLASPILLVGDVLGTSVKRDHVAVRVKTAAGKEETIELPKEAVARAKLQPGDKLTVKPAKTGAVLAKNDMAIAFMTTPENGKLSHSHELAR